MGSARWRKAWTDIRSGGTRTVMAVLAVALGVVGVGGVWTALTILSREMAADFAATRPSSASIWTDRVDDALVSMVRRTPGVEDAEARRTVSARARVGQDEWRPVLLFVVRDFTDVHLDTFEPERGAFPPRTGQVLFERVTPRVVPALVGDTVAFQVPGQAVHRLTVSGTVHAAGLAPAWMEGTGYGFISADTAVLLGAPSTFDELKVAFRGAATRQAVSRRTQGIVATLEATGHPVARVEIREPGDHPHASQLATLLFLLQAFGLLALVLSAVLVASMVDSLLARQVRQIGIMKAVGASASQIAANYFAVVAVLGLLACGPALLVATAAGRLYSRFVATMLNFDLSDASVPSGVLALQTAVGVLLPLVVSAWPVWRGTRVTVREALSDCGVSVVPAGGRRSWLPSHPGLPNPARYAFRTLARGWRRMALTLVTLAAGGTTFLAASNIRAAMEAMVDAKFAAQPYDVHVTFAEPQPIGRVQDVLAQVPGATRFEAWGGGWASRVRPDGSLGNAFRVFAPPADSRLAGQHEMADGRWLNPADHDALVVNQMVIAAEPDLAPGQSVELSVNGRRHRFVLVGIARERMAPMVGYTTFGAYADAAGQPGLAQAAVVSSARRDRAAGDALARAVERVLPAAGIEVAASLKTADFRQAVVDHLLVIARVLLAMSLLVVAVGGLGLTSAMSIRVLERTRELGIIRAVGGSRSDILRIVMIEAGAVAVASWLLAAALMVPVSAWLSGMFGMIFFKAPLAFTVSASGMAAWLLLACLVSIVASIVPASAASTASVARALAYE